MHTGSKTSSMEFLEPFPFVIPSEVEKSLDWRWGIVGHANQKLHRRSICGADPFLVIPSEVEESLEIPACSLL